MDTHPLGQAVQVVAGSCCHGSSTLVGRSGVVAAVYRDLWAVAPAPALDQMQSEPQWHRHASQPWYGVLVDETVYVVPGAHLQASETVHDESGS